MDITSLAVSALLAYQGAGHRAPQRPYVERDATRAASAGPADAGRASVIDGDTIDIHGRRYRLFGIDAPESSQSCEDAQGVPYPCGRRAAQALDRLLEGKVVSCSARDTDRYGRTVAVCTAGGVDINGWMVRNGQAIAYVRYGADYAGAEAVAKRERVGIWQGRFEEPSRYRQENKQGGRGYGGYGNGSYGGRGYGNGNPGMAIGYGY